MENQQKTKQDGTLMREHMDMITGAAEPAPAQPADLPAAAEPVAESMEQRIGRLARAMQAKLLKI